MLLHISLFNTKTKHLSSLFAAALLCFRTNLTYTLAGFEPGSSAPEADAFFTTPSRKGA
jgi:hypothetical protein